MYEISRKVEVLIIKIKKQTRVVLKKLLTGKNRGLLGISLNDATGLLCKGKFRGIFYWNTSVRMWTNNANEDDITKQDWWLCDACNLTVNICEERDTFLLDMTGCFLHSKCDSFCHSGHYKSTLNARIVHGFIYH